MPWYRGVEVHGMFQKSLELYCGWDVGHGGEHSWLRDLKNLGARVRRAMCMACLRLGVSKINIDIKILR